MVKVIVLIIAILLLIPVIAYIFPEELTVESIQAKLKARGFTIEDVQEAKRPMNEADKQWTMKINGERTDLYFYTDSAKLTTQREYQRKDPGTAIVESMHLRESLGAAPNPNLPTYIGKRQKFMMIVTTNNEPFGRRLIYNFEDL